MRNTYEIIPDLFKLTTWDEDIRGPFGLQPPPGDWEAFKTHIQGLQESCEAGERIVVIYAARHGQAEHNKLHEIYDEPDDVIQINHPILDPHLTPKGVTQAHNLALALQREIGRGMPKPDKWFVSPLRRVGETCITEWGWLFPSTRPSSGIKSENGEKVIGGGGVPAFVVEDIREHLHVHLCDSRLSKSELKSQFPSFTYPDNMSEEDDTWQPGSMRGRETEEELVERCGRGIEECINMSRDVTYISVTAHSGAMRGIYKSLGILKPRSLEVGEMNVLVVKVKKA